MLELTRRWRPGRPVSLAAILGPMRRGGGDPCFRFQADSVWRAIRTPAGPATLRLAVARGDGVVEASSWGSGAQWALDAVPDMLGADDDPAGFEPTHPLLRETHRRNPGWRVPRTGLVLEALAPAVFEQKVTSHEAWRGWRQLVCRYGEAAPGPDAVQALRMHVPPTPQVWSRVPSWEWHRAGVDQTRSRTVVRAASVAGRLEQITGLAHDEAAARLRSLPGVGVWTAAEVAQRALGDPDAVSVGDFHLAGLVGWALVGEKVDDDGMLELLEPYRGHRYRAVRMIELSGIAPPRRGQRFAGRDYRAM
ncbi:MAG: DNA-3-methyladenine glycosylase 2 family protein [Sporichthyaceae bacterium]